MTTTVVQTRDARLPMPGSLIVKKYKDRTLVVKVLDDGFEYDGRRFTSLSAIAGEITGTRWNGFAFFGLGEGGASCALTNGQKENGNGHAARACVVRCAIYTRKSTEEGLEQAFNTLDAQREAGGVVHQQPAPGRLGGACRRSTTTAATPAPTWTARR